MRMQVPILMSWALIILYSLYYCYLLRCFAQFASAKVMEIGKKHKSFEIKELSLGYFLKKSLFLQPDYVE